MTKKVSHYKDHALYDTAFCGYTMPKPYTNSKVVILRMFVDDDFTTFDVCLDCYYHPKMQMNLLADTEL